jgi:hypothetical protein
MILIKVVKAVHKQDHVLELTFNDGTLGEVDLKSSLKGPVFEPLKDVEYFKKFKVNRWTIEWENGADFAPEYLYGLVTHSSKLVIEE